MSSYLSMEEIRQWRSSTEKITLEEFALRLGKALNEKKETHDMYDIIQQTKEPMRTEISISFKKELTLREKIVFEYFSENKGKKVSIKELSKVLNIPNSYVYKYIKTLREKLSQNILVNADNGGYVFNIK